MKTIFTALILMLAVSGAFAGDTTVKFNTPTVVNGTKVAPGEYILRYDIKGKVADVKIIQDRRMVAATTATVAENENNAAYNGVVKESKADGTVTLKEIQFANKKQVIRFEVEGTAVGK